MKQGLVPGRGGRNYSSLKPDYDHLLRALASVGPSGLPDGKGGRVNTREKLAEWLREMRISVPIEHLQWFVNELMRAMGRDAGEAFVPAVVFDLVPMLLEGQVVKTACDPYAGQGVLAARVHDAVQPETTLACTPDPGNRSLGELLAPKLEWHIGQPLSFLAGIAVPLDVVMCAPPFGLRISREQVRKEIDGQNIPVGNDLAETLLAASSTRLSQDGVGLFVVPSRFFFANNSILRRLPDLGLGLEAAFALPAGSFAPITNIAAYLVVIRKRLIPRMFAAQLSQDVQTNWQIVKNWRDRKTDGAPELGTLIAPDEFRGFEVLQFTRRLQQAERLSENKSVCLEQIAEAMRLGRPGDDFKFEPAQNAIYIPLIGISDVVASIDDLKLKLQNYAQVIISPNHCDARFVAHYLNSELGRDIRESQKTGIAIPKLNTTGLKKLPVVVPALHVQEQILNLEVQLRSEQNTLRSLQNDVLSLRRQLWSGATDVQETATQIREFSSRLNVDVAPQAAVTLEQWLGTLPFPLASVLRAWQATQTEDYKAKYEHLLHFFEAAAEFFSVILLSAFSSNADFFAEHRGRLQSAWQQQRLTVERATFGTWKVVIEYLGKQTRELLAGDSNARRFCADLFADPVLGLPEMLARKEVAEALSKANKFRNDWSGHGGIVGSAEAQLRNELLVEELQNLRQAMADGWNRVQMIQCIQCKPRGGRFQNELTILVGSDPEFLKESRWMDSYLDVDRLYLVTREATHALLLLGLMQIGASPTSAKNACYFFNRLEKDCVRFISYHYVDQPELKNNSEDAREAIDSLTKPGLDFRLEQ